MFKINTCDAILPSLIQQTPNCLLNGFTIPPFIVIAHPIQFSNVATRQGGIKAVIWTDVLQCLLMILGLVMVVVQGSIEAGGILEPWRIANENGRVVFTE